MNTKEPANDLHQRIREEHDELREHLGAIHHVIAERSNEIGAAFASLREQVASHFAEEEASGFFTQMTEAAPRMSEQLAHLKNEHADMLKQLESITTLVEANDETADWWQQVDDRIHDFSKALMHHENAESSLLLDIYDTDIGPSD